MGYFSNGSEGLEYEDRYCQKCVHYKNCMVWLAHIEFNYKECNNKNSILNYLIPIDEKGNNLKCAMFVESKEDRETLRLFQ